MTKVVVLTDGSCVNEGGTVAINTKNTNTLLLVGYQYKVASIRQDGESQRLMLVGLHDVRCLVQKHAVYNGHLKV